MSRGRVVERFVELEAELKKGEGDELAALGAAIESEAGLERARISKLEAAMAALDGAGGPDDEPETRQVRGARRRASMPTRRRLVVGKSPGVTADDHVAEAGRKVMRFHLARMIEREPGVRSGVDAEDVHKMRVATRRQRAAWRVFGEAYRRKRTRDYRDGLRGVARRLGAVRDLDVQLEATDAYRADLPVAEQRALEPLLGAWRQHREDARTAAHPGARLGRRTAGSSTTTSTSSGPRARPSLPVGVTEPHRVRDTAPSRIWSAYEQVRTYEPVLRWADVPTLHELRITAKWLRYSLEFVEEALGAEARPLIEKVTGLQDHLGLMNDADVSASMARTFLVEHASDLSQLESAAIGRYLVDREREVARLRRSIGLPWRRIAGPGFRRSLGRVVAGL